MGGKKLLEGYKAVWNGTAVFTSNYGSMELMTSSSPTVFCIGDYSWGSNWNGPYASNTFGIYYNLEKSPHNGNIYNGGIFERSPTHWQLTNFNLNYGVGKETVSLPFHFHINAGTYSYVSGKVLSQKMVFYNLYLIKN